MSLIDQILTVTTNRPTEQQLVEPRTYRRRATWVPVVGEKVTVWRMTSHDPDRDLSHSGIFIAADDRTYFVQVEGGAGVESFPKKDEYGVSLWRLDARGTQHQTETNK
jgi:hypothetical protein